MDTTNIKNIIGNYIKENLRDGMYKYVVGYTQRDVLECISHETMRNVWRQIAREIHDPVVGQIKSTIYEHH